MYNSKKCRRNKKQMFWIILLFSYSVNQLSLVSAQNQKFDSLANEVNKLSVIKKTKALEMLANLYQMAKYDPDSSLMISRCLFEETLLMNRHGIIDTLLKNRIKERLNRQNLYLQEEAELQYSLSIFLMTEGLLSDAFTLQLQVLDKFKQLKNNRLTAKVLNSLGNICWNIGLLNLAEQYYSDALKNVTPDHFEYYIFKSNSYTVLFKKDVSAAIDSIFSLLKIAEEKKYEYILPTLYLSAGTFILDSLPEVALHYFTKMKNLEFDNLYTMAILYSNIGYYYLQINDFPVALQYFKDAKNLMETNNDLVNLPINYHLLSVTFEKMNLCDSALFYARQDKNTTEKILSNTTSIENHQKYITTISEAREKDLLIAEQKIGLKKRQIAIIIIVSGSIILLILIFLLYVNQLRKRKIIETREAEAKLEHEKRIKYYENRQRKLEKIQQKELIDSKTREISSFSLLVSNKNQLLKEILYLNAQEHSKIIKTKIDEIIHNSLNVDEQWENFKLHFEKVHPQFFDKLKQKCSGLTEENLKICAYLKMGMTNKQIANILNVIPDTIITSRNRLKKKLKIPKEENLNSFIRNI